MQDSQIVDLFFERDEDAIVRTSEKYGSYCLTVANNILADSFDSEECVNDAYLAAWNSIPPERPERLGAYLARLTRNSALNRYKAKRRERRGGGEFELSLDELSDCVKDSFAFDEEEIGRHISDFLRGEKKTNRQVFVRRYFYNDSVAGIAKRFSLGESNVKSILHRTRLGLRDYLEKHDVYI